MRSFAWLFVALAVLGHPVCVLSAETRVLAPAASVPLHSRVDVRALSTPWLSESVDEARARVMPRLSRDPETLRAWKVYLETAPPAMTRAPDSRRDSRSRSAAAPTPAVVSAFEGPSNADNAALTGLVVLPPDPNLGVGPSHVFQIVNIVGRISDKAGASVSSFSLRSFFGLDPDTTETDPRVLYDAKSGRWFATYLQSSTVPAATGTSSIMLAVSTTSDPTGTFCRYRLGNPTAETFLQDFPQLGVSDDKVAVSYNAFAFPRPNRFLGAGYYVINKADLIGCGSPRVVRMPPDPSRFTALPAQSLSDTGVLYLVMNDTDTVSIFGVQGLPGVGDVGETSTVLGIRSWTAPPNAPQPGSTLLLDTGDERVLSVKWQNNSLWVAGNEACTPAGDTAIRSCLRVIEARTDSSSVRQDMSFGAVAEYFYYPALSPDGAANLAVTFTSSSTGEFASVRVTGRSAADELSTLQPSTLLRAGAGAQTSPSVRMGDYSGAALDPADPSSVWVMAEYIRSAGASNWGTYVARLRLSPTILLAAVLPSSRSVQVGTPATAFATVINAGSSAASGVGITLNTSIPATITYQTTDPITNAVTGTPNTPADIGPGQSQSYVIAITPKDAVAPTEVAFAFTAEGPGIPPAGTLTGVDTLLLSASRTPVPDIVALAATTSNDGTVGLGGPSGMAAFAVATVNVGASGVITVSADTGGAAVPVIVALCRTDSLSGQCISAVGTTATTPIDAGQTPTFGIFLAATGPVVFDPAVNRIFVRFKDADGVTRGSTSVAVRTQ